MTPPAQGASLTWDPVSTSGTAVGGSGTWDLSNSAWFNGSAATLWTDSTGALDYGVFSGSAGTVTISTNLGARGLIFNTPGYTLAGSGTLNLGVGGIDASGLSGGTTTIGNTIQLTPGLQKWTVGAGATLALGSIGVLGGDPADAYTPAGAIVFISKGAGANVTTTTADGWGWRSGAVAGTGVLGAGMVIDNGNGTYEMASVGSQTAGTARAIVAPTYTTAVNGDAHNVRVTSNTTLSPNASWASILVNGATLTNNGGGSVSVDTGIILENGGAINGTAALRANADGLYVYVPNTGSLGVPITNNGSNAKGLYLAGSGTLSLTGNDTFTGATKIYSGALNVSGGGNINSSSGITVMGSSAKYIHSSSVASTRTITLTQGSVDGTGTVGTVNVADLAGNTIANGNGSAATLTIGSLSFSGKGLLSVTENGATKGVAVTGALTTANTGAGEIVVNATNASGWSSIGGNGSGVYDLITFGSITGGTADFSKGAIAGLSGRQNATLGLSPTAVTLTITGDAPIWSGAGSQTWTTAAFNDNTGPNAWALLSGHTPTNFWAGDTATFNDTYNLGSGDVAVTNSTVTIHGGVAPATAVFNNSAVDYAITSDDSTGITAGSLSKTGSGKLTLLSNNTYTGITSVNGGTLQIGNGSTGSISSSSAVSVAAGATLGVNLVDSGTLANNIANSGTVTMNGTHSNTLSGVISGAGSVTVSGSGNLTLSGNSTFSGQLSVLSGTLSVANVNNANASGPLGSSSLPVNLGGAGSNGTLEYTGGAGTLNTTKVFSLATSGTGTIRVDNSAAELRFTAANCLTGSGLLVKTGPGQLSMGDGGQNFSGGVLVEEGNLQAGNNNASFGTGAITLGSQGSNKNASIGIGNGGISATNVIKVGSGSGTRTIIGGSGGDETFSGAVTLGDAGGAGSLNLTTVYVGNGNSSKLFLTGAVSGTGNLNLYANNNYNTNGSYDVVLSGNQNQSGTISSIDAPGGVANPTHGINTISGALGAGISNVTQNSANSTLVLSGNNPNFAGTVTVAAGTLKLGSSSALNAKNQVTVSGGAILDLNGNDATMAGLGTGSGTITNSGALHTLTLGGTTSSSFAGSIGGNTSLTVGLTGGAVQTLTGNCSYTGATTINAGAGLDLASESDVALSTLANNGAMRVLGPISLSVSSAISGTGSMAFLNSGNTTLNGASPAYTGPMTVSGGSLIVNGAMANSSLTLDGGILSGGGSLGAVTVTSAGSSIFNGAGAGNTNTLTLGSLALSGPASVNISSAGSAGLAIVGALATNSVAGKVVVNGNNTGWVLGNNNLLNFGSFSGSLSDFMMGDFTGFSARMAAGSLVVNGNNIALNVTGVAPVWSGLNGGVWQQYDPFSETSGAPEWKVSAAGDATDFWTGDSVILDDTATGTTTVTLHGGNITAGAITFNNSALNYTLASDDGSGIAAGTLIKNGTGTLTINSTHTFTGATIIGGGTLQLGDGTTDGDISQSSGITNNGRLVFNRSNGSFTYANTISGTGSVTMTGLGTQILSGTNSYSGGTVVNSGILELGSSSTGSGNSVASGPLGTGTVTLNGGTVQMAAKTLGNNLFVPGGASASIDNSGGNSALTGNLSGSGTLALNNTSATAVSASIGSGADWSGFTGALGYNVSNGNFNLTAPSSLDLSNASVTFSGNNPSSSWRIPASGTNRFGALAGSGYLDNAGVAEVGKLGVSGTFAGLIRDYAGVGAGGIRKVGAGTWTLSGSNTYTGATTINGGILQVGDGSTGSISASSSVAINSGAGLDLKLAPGATFSNAVANSGTMRILAPLTLSSVMNGSGALVVANTGTTTLTGVSSGYTGAASVNSGNLMVNGAIANSTLTLNGGTLSGSGTVGSVIVANAGASITNGTGGTNTKQLSLGNLSFNTAGILNLNRVNDFTTPALVVSGSLSTVSGIVINLPQSAVWSSTTYNLMSYGIFSGNASDFHLGMASGLGGRSLATFASTAPTGGFITMTISGDNPVWTGSTSNAWTTATISGDKNWKLITQQTPTDFLPNDLVLFDDTGANTNVNISDANVAVAGVTFANNTKDYTIGSSGGYGIADGTDGRIASLTMTGTGKVTLATQNIFSGVTTIGAGTLQLGDGTSNGDISQSSGIVNNGRLVFNRTAGSSFTYSHVISGSGSVTVAGSGTQVLSANNTYTGGTVINSGALQLGNGGATGSIASTGTLINNGSLVLNRSNAMAEGTDFPGLISGSGNLVQLGSGTTTISGGNAYTGGTQLAAGVLTLGNSSSIGSGTLTLAGGVLNNLAAITLSNPIALNGNAEIRVGSGNNFSVNSNLSGSGKLTFGDSSYVMSIYIGMSNAMTSGTIVFANNANSLRIGTASFGNSQVAYVFNNTGGNRESLDYGAGTINFGSLSGNGVLGGNSNGDKVLSVGALGLNDTFSGSIRDVVGGGVSTVGLTKVGAGTLTLSGNNTYTGATVVNSGTLALGAGGSIASTSALTVAAGATVDATASNLTLNASTVSLNGTINGNVILSGSLNASSTAVLNGDLGLAYTSRVTCTALNIPGAFNVYGSDVTLSGSLAAGGNANVNWGAKFTLDHSTLSSPNFSVQGTLAGSGTFAGSATVNGTISPGLTGSTGRITLTNTVTFSGGSLLVKLDNNLGLNDLLEVEGNLDLSDGFDTLTVQLLNSTPTTRNFVIATYTGSLLGEFATVNGLPAGYQLDTMSVPGEIILAAVPEPGTWAMIVGGLGMLVLAHRRRGFKGGLN